MANLRWKIELDPTRPRLLRTEQGVGYRLSTDDIPDAESESTEQMDGCA